MKNNCATHKSVCILWFPILFLFVALTYPVISQEQPQNYWSQYGDSPVDMDWQAQWIWTKPSLKADMVLARRTFDLQEVPQKSTLFITASSQYQLFINGQYIRRGPARSAPHHQSYDILDVRPYLQKGANCIAIRVHHQQNKYAYHFKGRPGMLAQLELTSNNNYTIISTDDQWKVLPDPAWDSQAPVVNRFQMVVVDRMDLRKKATGWNTKEYNDQAWPQATPLIRNVGWPSPPPNAKPQPLTPPWTTLVARDVPYLLEKSKRITHLIEATSVDTLNITEPIVLSGHLDESIASTLTPFQEGGGPLVVPSSAQQPKGYFMVFDLGEIHNGFPFLNVEGPAGTKIDILMAPFVVDNQFTQRILDSDFHDQITLSGKKDRWEATYFKPTRYLGLYIHGHHQPVTLQALDIRYLEYPFETKGRIYSSDAEWVERYMQATAKTIEVCTTDGYTDNYRERRQYAQTGYYGALGNYWLFNDRWLQRRYLIQVSQEQDANGIMPAYAPLASDDYMVILDSNCLWLRSLHDYLLFTGDTKTVTQLLPAALKLLQLLDSYTSDLGLITNPPYPYWLDHSVIDRQGANFCLNGHYLGALKDFADVLDWLDQPGSEIYRTRALRVQQSLQQYLWDDEKGLFSDALIHRELSPQFSEHANAMALAEHVASPEQAESIITKVLENDELNYINRASGMTMVTPAMSYFLHKGLCEYDQIDASFSLFNKRFDKMLQPQYNGTLWEEWWLDATGRSGRLTPKPRSDAHTESAFPPALIGNYLLGIEPTQPGWTKA
ncbi:MAG: family 78 glycoside hydrolase catalytic domain, partial [Saprospiraceae bacterium]|nr:family 78 glycoside hydrolase catalytic domain [Saprospiraceae bacterium]